MNIYAEEGDKVIFNKPTSGYPNDQEEAQIFLREGNIYTVDYVDIRDCISYVKFKEVPGGKFNTVLFSDWEEPSEWDEPKKNTISFEDLKKLHKSGGVMKNAPVNWDLIDEDIPSDLITAWKNYLDYKDIFNAVLMKYKLDTV